MINTQLDLFPSETHLRRVDPKQNMYRFYAVTVEPTLFNEWAVVRRWGRIGTAGSTRVELHESMGEAINAVEQVNRSKLRRGYQQA